MKMAAQLRDFLDVADVARANVLLMERPEADFRVFNVGPGRATTVLDFARLVLRVAGSNLEPVVSGQFRVGDTRHTVSDITALSSLGWSADIPLERTIERYIEWIKPFQETRGLSGSRRSGDAQPERDSASRSKR